MMLGTNTDRQIVHQATIRPRPSTSIGGIDYERILNGENIAREFFCPICSCLLWQPRSCGVCQNLFCEPCIFKWLQVKSNCPYGCERYEDKRCSPQIRCLLSNIWIRCQSFEYGCTALLSYDTLEDHQTKQCPYPSTRCQYCENLMLVTEIKDHEQECGQRLGNCAKYNNLIPMFLMETHQLSCVTLNPQENYLQTNNQLQTLTQPVYTYEVNIPIQNNAITLTNIFNLTEEDRYIQNQYHELVWWHRLWRLFSFILTNPSNVPYILLTIWQTGYGYMIGSLIGYTFLIFGQCFRNLFTGFLFIIFLTGALHSGVPWFLNLIDDKSIMIIFTILYLVIGCSVIYMNAHQLNKKRNPGYVLLEYVAIIILWKLALMIVRFYFHWIPAYVTSTSITGISIFIFLIVRLAISSQQTTQT